MKFENGWWCVPHDHKSEWPQKAEWCCEIVGIQGIDWTMFDGSWLGAADACKDERLRIDPTPTGWDTVEEFNPPIRFGFKSQQAALLFKLRWT